jgi:hypothetical protein
MHTCVSVYVYICSFFVCFAEYSWLTTSLFLLDTGILFCPTTSCRPCHPAFLPGFHRLGVCVCLSWLSTEILCLSASVVFLSLLDMYLPVFLVLLACVCVFLCHGVHRQTNRHSRDISEIVPTHTLVCAHAGITRTPLSCGGDECDADSLALLIHTYLQRHTSMHVCLFDFLSIRDSSLLNSDSISLHIPAYIRTCILVCVCMYIFVLFCFSEYTSHLVA